MEARQSLGSGIIYSSKGKELLLPKQEASEGYTLIASARNCPLTDLEVGRLRLLLRGESKYQSDTKEREVALYILTGKCNIEAKGKWGSRKFESVGERNNVFAGKPSAVILPPGTRYSVSVTSTSVDIFVASVPVEDRERLPSVVRPQDVEVRFIGEGNHRREVRAIPGWEGKAGCSRIGETINPPGGWSAWPRHPFDYHPEMADKFEEVFLFFTKPRDGWALHRSSGHYSNGEAVDDVWLVRNGDYAMASLGERHVVAAPDTTVLYVWCYISPVPEVYPTWAEDLGEYAA
ncbi:5-deoxy-glucuronate isomerase [Chloroflexota bacterium]